MVERVLTTMFDAGLFRSNQNPHPIGTGYDAGHAAVAEKVAVEGTVLLKNKRRLLPLHPATVGTVAVIGTDASESPLYNGGGSSGVNPSGPPVSPLDGIRTLLGGRAKVTYNDGTDVASAVAAARAAKVAVIFAGYYEAEQWSLNSIDLGRADDTLIQAVAAAQPKTVVVLNTGSAVSMPWLSAVPAVLEQWYPGQTMGTAAAAVLFGRADPSGHLPVTFPTSLAAVPDPTTAEYPGAGGQVDYSEGYDVGYRWYEAHHVKPLFPFGFGLSYSTFAFSHLRVSAFGETGLARVTARVTNTGAVPGADVPQLYIADPASTGEPPWQLKGFQRVTLAPGASAVVRFGVPRSALTYWRGGGCSSATGSCSRSEGWAAPAGQYAVGVGDSSAQLPLRGSLRLVQPIGPDLVQLVRPADQRTPAGRAVDLVVASRGDTTSRALSYSAFGLPGSLFINRATGIISGVPLHPGTSTVTVTATDTYGYQAESTFRWTVTGTDVGPAALPGSITTQGGRCLDAVWPQQGGAVDVDQCDGGVGQVFTYLRAARRGGSGALQALGGCLQPARGGRAPGTPVEYYACDGGQAQFWAHPNNGELVNAASGFCLDAPGAPASSSTPVQLQPCTAASSQFWYVAVGSAAGVHQLGPIIGDGELCLDIENGINKPGNAVRSYTCNGNPSQIWLAAGDGELQAMGGCLDVEGGTPRNGSLVDYNACDGSPTQVWDHLPDGEYVDRVSNLCLTIPGISTAPGAAMAEIKTCDGSAQQLWTAPGGDPVGPETTTTVPTSTTTLPPSQAVVPGVNCAARPSGARLDRQRWTATSAPVVDATSSPGYALDGNLQTRFSSDTAQAPGMDLRIDLASPHSFDEIEMQVPGSPDDYARGYDVYVSADGTRWLLVAGCQGRSTPEVVSFKGQTARYIEIVLTASWSANWWSIDEFYVYSTVLRP